LGHIPKLPLALTFVFADYLIAHCVSSLAYIKVEEQKQEIWPEVREATEDDKFVGETDDKEDESCLPFIPKKPYDDPLEDKKLIPKDPTIPIDYIVVPKDIGSLYLLNPLSIIACVAQNTQIYSNLGMALALYFASKGKIRPAMFSLACASYLSMYPIILVAPCVLLHSRQATSPVIFDNADPFMDYEVFLVSDSVPGRALGSFILHDGKLEFHRRDLWDHVLFSHLEYLSGISDLTLVCTGTFIWRCLNNSGCSLFPCFI
jgi:hypothetical protein